MIHTVQGNQLAPLQPSDQMAKSTSPGTTPRQMQSSSTVRLTAAKHGTHRQRYLLRHLGLISAFLPNRFVAHSSIHHWTSIDRLAHTAVVFTVVGWILPRQT